MPDSAGTPALEIRGLTKSFGDFHALRGVDLIVGRGETVAIFGPNGAGKTTLIKLLATIMRPSSGRIIIDGLDTRTHPEEARRRIGVVTHQTYLYGNLTVSENLEFYATMYDVSHRQERIREVVRLVAMTSRLHDRVSTLSRGMQQRISIARALLHQPGIVLLDEPETGLDEQSVSLLWKALEREEGRRTVLMTTHNLERGLRLSERLLIVNRGKIVYQAPSISLDLAGLKETYRQRTEVRA